MKLSTARFIYNSAVLISGVWLGAKGVRMIDAEPIKYIGLFWLVLGAFGIVSVQDYFKQFFKQ